MWTPWLGYGSEVLPERSSGKKWVAPSNLEYCEHAVPMVQGVLQGSWYGDKADSGDGASKHGQGQRNCIREHRRTINDYSQVVKAIKPAHRKSPPPALSASFSSGCGSHRAEAIEVYPTSAQEVEDIYGRLSDARAAESMASYLAGASPKERHRFMRTLHKARAHSDTLLQAVGAAQHPSHAHEPPQRLAKPYLRKTQVEVGRLSLSRPASSLGTLIPHHIPPAQGTGRISAYGRPASVAAKVRL